MRRIPALNYPAIDVPLDQLVGIFRAFERVLQTDGTFTRAVNTFLSWRGTAQDTVDPTWTLCPFCRISPAAVPMDMATEIQHRATLKVQVEIAVKGTRLEELGNLWGVVRNAVFPQDDRARRDEVQAILQGAGVTRPVLRMASFHHLPDGDSDNLMLVGMGSIDFNTLVFT